MNGSHPLAAARSYTRIPKFYHSLTLVATKLVDSETHRGYERERVDLSDTQSAINRSKSRRHGSRRSDQIFD